MSAGQQQRRTLQIGIGWLIFHMCAVADVDVILTPLPDAPSCLHSVGTFRRLWHAQASAEERVAAITTEDALNSDILLWEEHGLVRAPLRTPAINCTFVYTARLEWDATSGCAYHFYLLQPTRSMCEPALEIESLFRAATLREAQLRAQALDQVRGKHTRMHAMATVSLAHTHPLLFLALVIAGVVASVACVLFFVRRVRKARG